MKRTIVAITVFLALMGQCAYGASKILFIGNSHDLDATDLLPFMLNMEGVRDLELTRTFHGGYYLVGYNTFYDKPANCSITTWKAGDRFWRGDHNYNYSLKDAVEADTYDIVVIQEYSGNKHCWVWDEAEKKAINGLIEKIHAKSPKAEIVYFISHCHSSGSKLLAEYFGDDDMAQYKRVIENNAARVMDPSEGFPIKRIISTATLVQNLRTSSLNVGRGLLRGDGIHLDYGMTRFAASLLVWKTLFTPLTGIGAEELKFRFTEFYPCPTRYTTPAEDESMPVILAAVNAAFDRPLELTDLSSFKDVPLYADKPGSVVLNDTGVDIHPVSFPVTFNLGYRDGKPSSTYLSQPLWLPYGVWFSTVQDAFAKYVIASNPVEGSVATRGFATSAKTGVSSISLNEIWTGDYFEFVIPVKNIREGTKIRFSAPFYTRQGPCFWYLDYLDGNEWKCNHSVIPSVDGGSGRDATFAISYGTTDISCDVVLSKPVKKGYMRFRLRCADGTLQAGKDGVIQRDAPLMRDGKFSQVFYFQDSGNPGAAVTFSIVE